jgi:hypothetical protein
MMRSKIKLAFLLVMIQNVVETMAFQNLKMLCHSLSLMGRRDFLALALRWEINKQMITENQRNLSLQESIILISVFSKTKVQALQREEFL